MIRIAICDDEPQELAKAGALLTKYAFEHPQYEIEISSFFAPFELLSRMEEQGDFDVLMLDVYMAGMLGTEAARELRQLGYEGEIIFITTSREHSLTAFEVNAAQYLIKPYDEERIFAALDKVIRHINVERRDVISLKTSDGITLLAPRDVVFTEAGRKNYQIIHTVQGNKIEVRMKASEIFELLSPNKFFVRCGVSINLNLKYIRQISKDTIIFDTGEHLLYPYRAYQRLREEFLRFQMSTED